MYIFLIVLHLFACSLMIGVILLQAGKGAEMGAAFGGSSQTIFGGRGAATFLSKLTVGAAILFMATSLSLSILSRERSVTSSVKLPAAEETAPADKTQEGAPSGEKSSGQSEEGKGSSPESPSQKPQQ